jgi:uncharacterized protein (TIGR02145 family)
MKNLIKFIGLGFLLISIVFHSCKKEEVPTLTTSAIINITGTTASCGGTITDEGSGTVITKGVCWSTGISPTIADNKTTDGAGAGSFESAITGLSANTIYYVRAYATNASGIGYGMAMSFTTLPPTTPVLTTADITDITQNTATCGGNITSDGAASITSRGVCWSTAQNPTIVDSKTSDGSGIGSFTSTLTELIGNTSYYVRAYATNSAGTSYGSQISFKTNPILPTILTATTFAISQTSAISGGNVTDDGGAGVVKRGVCWSTTSNPTIANSVTEDGTGAGIFTSSITGLVAGTTYYVRAYATNIVGTAYGLELIFVSGLITDIDGNAYPVVTIGTQTWMSENLRTTKYQNGDLIGTTNPATLDLSGESTPKYQWASGLDENNVEINGRLYTWYAVTDSRNVCPTGWHVPTYAEWTTLTDFLTNNGFGYQGSGSDIAKSMAATSGWNTDSLAGPGSIGNDQASNNSSGFTAKESGYRLYYGAFTFRNIVTYWSVSETNSTNSYYLYMTYLDSYVYISSYFKKSGFSVRCIKDN